MMGNAPLLSGDLDVGVDDTPLAIAWAKLAAASRVMDPAAAHEEYEALFGGVGKSAVTLFASAYASANSPGEATRFLVDLRADLVRRGIAMRHQSGVPEDHCSALFETMRLLIGGDGEISPAGLESQNSFFQRFIAPFYATWCAAIMHHSVANFYRAVAECVNAFLAIEDESLAIA
jgi:TorA maturation chaperone TorD